MTSSNECPRGRTLFELATCAVQLSPESQEWFLGTIGPAMGIEEELRSLVGERIDGEPPRDGQTLDGDAGVTPTRVGPYEIGSLLGEGSMGKVFAARSENPEREVAIKFYTPSSPEVALRFPLEAKTLCKLNHPYIPQIYHADLGAKPPYIAMELARGVRLDKWAKGNHSTRERIRCLMRIASAVQYIHTIPLVHRDIKPANVLVDADGRPKLLDFGIAKPLPGARGLQPVTTLHGAIGTRPYASPEQCRADAAVVDVRSDVYGLGALAYRVLTGRKPPDLGSPGKGHADLAPHGRIEGLNSDLTAIVMRAMKVEVEDRYQSAREFREDLERHLKGLPIRARRVSPWSRAGRAIRRHPLRATGITLIVGLLASIVYLDYQAARAQYRSTYAATLALNRPLPPDYAEAGRKAVRDLIELGMPEFIAGVMDYHLASRNSQYPAALQALDLVEQGAPDRTDVARWVYEHRGITRLEMGEWAEAEAYFLRAITTSPPGEVASNHLRKLLGLTVLLQGFMDRADEIMEPLARESPSAFNGVYLEAAHRGYSLGKLAHSRVLLNRLKSRLETLPMIDPLQRIVAEDRLAGQLWQIGDLPTAARILESTARNYESTLENHPDLRSTVLNSTGVVLRDMELYAEAEPLLLESLELKTAALERAAEQRGSSQGPRILEVSCAATYNNLARLNLGQGRLQLAMEQSLEALRFEWSLFTLSETLLIIGSIWLEEGFHEAARTLFQESLRLRSYPGFHHPWLLGECHSMIGASLWKAGGNPAVAYQELEKGVELVRPFTGPESRLFKLVCSNLEEFVDEHEAYGELR